MNLTVITSYNIALCEPGADQVAQALKAFHVVHKDAIKDCRN